MAIGNWQQKTAGDQIEENGKIAVIGRNEGELQVSIDGNNWETVHQFPTGQGEFFVLDLPTETFVRVTAGGQWAYARYNEMSG